MKKLFAAATVAVSIVISAGFAYDSYLVKQRLAKLEYSLGVTDAVQVMVLDELSAISYTIENKLDTLIEPDPYWPSLIESDTYFQDGPELELN